MTVQQDGHEFRARRRNAPVEVVLACFRLVKACQIHDDSNQTVQQLIPDVVSAVREYCELAAAESVRIMFSTEVVFINRKLMRAPRETYAIALQLGELLAHADANEVAFERSLEPAAALSFARLIVEAQRSPDVARQLTQTEIRGVSVRKVPEADELEMERKSSPTARVVKAYAASILILQGFYRDLASGSGANPQALKRVAQKLVGLAERHPELLMAAAAAPPGDAAPARRAVSSAVLAIAMVRKLSADRALSTSVAQSALLVDLGVTLAGDEDNARVRAGVALAYLLETGGLHPPSLRRSALAHQALSGDACDPEHALVLAQILRISTRFNELRSPGGPASVGSLDGAIEQLQAECPTMDQPFVRLLVGALGLIPAGTFVELSTGEVAVVTGVPRQALDFARPRVRLLTDPKHTPLTSPVEVDLARPGANEPERAVKRALVGAGLSP